MFRIPSVLGYLNRLPSVSEQHATMHDDLCRIDHRDYGYGLVEGKGETIVLIHGWGLAHNSYRAAAEALSLQGFRVIVPDLPGFGCSSKLPFMGLSFTSYATAMRSFIEECHDIAGEPVHLVGHSFGGAVAAQLAHDSPDIVRSVVLVSSVTGATWRRDPETETERLLAERPIWDWGFHLISQFPVNKFPAPALGVLRDLSHNVLWHLPNMGLVANMIRHSDLRDELAKVRDQHIPVAVVWAAGDSVVTRACFDDQCKALGIDGTVVNGNHGWPLARPDSFGRTVGEIIRSMDSTKAQAAVSCRN
ncbi:MAG: alpha/beta fold hydrolase [Acidimicrobiales bacterium]